MSITVTENAYAKINLFLEVTGKRENGYHNIDSIMQSVSLSDTVTVSVSDGVGIELICGGALPCDDHNIAYRAIRLYNETYGIKAKTVCKIEKRIPISAGLAGGSADAAAVLRALDKIHGRARSFSELCSLGAKLGADVPFCITGGIAHTQGIGDSMSECPCLPDCFFVIACGESRKSTAEAYAEIDTLPEREIRSADMIISALRNASVTEIAKEMYNIFEKVTAYPQKIKDVMRSAGARGTLMSGSGTSVFGIFDDEKSVEHAVHELTSIGYFAASAKPI